MATYVMSDIHGYYDTFLKMLKKIKFSDEDTLYIIGDIVDRGPHPIKLMLDVMSRPNVVFLIGNHELMFCECMKTLLKNVTEEAMHDFDANSANAIAHWMRNGADVTINEMYEQTPETRQKIMDFVLNSDVYEEVQVAGKDYILVHAGFKNYEPDKEIWDYDVFDLVWDRPDYHTDYFPGKYVIMGHTPTQFVKDAEKPGYIYRHGSNTDIDCGCSVPDGRLGCLRLEDGKEFYVEKH